MTNAEVVQSGLRVWIKDVYRVGPPKQVRPQTDMVRERKQTDQLPAQPFFGSHMIWWEIQMFGGQSAILPGFFIHYGALIRVNPRACFPI